MSVSFDSLGFAVIRSLLAFWICCFQKHQGRFFKCFLVFGGLKNKTLYSHFHFHSSKKKKNELKFFSLPFSPPCPNSLPFTSGIGSIFAHPYGSISNSSCTGYQILCLLVPGSKSSADLWTSVQKNPGVWRKDAPLWIKSLHQLLSPIKKRHSPLMPCLNFSCSLRERMIY